jgi:hypothetical protein
MVRACRGRTMLFDGDFFDSSFSSALGFRYEKTL